MNCSDVKPLLDARLDGETDVRQSAAIDSHLSACAACRTDMETLENVRSAIRAGMPYRQAPAGLRDRVQFSLRGAGYLEKKVQRPQRKVWHYVAAAVILCALGVAPILVNARNQRQFVAREILSAHQRALSGREIDVVSSDQHTVKPWFNGKVPFSPPVADLRSEGFPLEGGRVDYIAGRPVAALVYSRRLHRIGVFVWPSADRQKPPTHFERDGYAEISWTKHDFVFAAVSDVSAPELATFARLLQRE